MVTQWIFAAGMRRAGSTMQYHWAKDLVESAGGKALGLISWQQFEEQFRMYDGFYPYVLLKGHVFYPDKCPNAKKLFENGRAKALYIYRDIRDVAISTYNMGKYTWEYIVETEVPSILREHEQWMSLREGTMFISNYELSYASLDNEMEISRIARFLGIQTNAKACRKIGYRHSLESNRKITQSMEKGFDRETLLWHNHIHSGKVGRYKDDLTPEQIADIEAIAGDWLKARGYM